MAGVEKQISCDKCEKVMPEHYSLTLPCGYSVCRKHVDYQSCTIDCFFCENHKISVNDCLNMPKNKQRSSRLEYALKLKELNERVQEFKNLREDPQSYVYKYYCGIIASIDSRRTQLKLDIDECYDQLIDNVKEVADKHLEKLEFNESFLHEIENFDFSESSLRMDGNLQQVSNYLSKLNSIKSVIEETKKDESIIENEKLNIEKLFIANKFSHLKLNQSE